jgi:hypothetical protein
MVTWKRDKRSCSMVVPELWAPMRCNWHRTPAPIVIATASGDDEAFVKSIGAIRVINYREEQFEKVLREGRCGLRLDRWRYAEAVVPRPEGRRPSYLCHPARIAGRNREVPCVGRDDEARSVGGHARKNRATAGRGSDTIRRGDRVPARGCSPGMGGRRRESARRSWGVAQGAGCGKTQCTWQDRTSRV